MGHACARAVVAGLATSGLRQPAQTESRAAASAGLAALKAGDAEAAIAAYGRALSEQRNPVWLEGRALAYERTGRLDLALRDLEEAEALGDPGVGSSLCEVATRFATESEKLGEHPERLDVAARYCTRLIEADGNNETALAFRASVRAAQQRLDDAKEDATAAVRLDENDARPRRTRAIIELQRGELQQAEDDCRKLMAPTKPPLVDFHVCVLAARGVGDEASFAARLDRGLRSYPEDAQLLEEQTKFGRR